MENFKVNTNLSKWGNSLATRIPKNIIKKLNLRDNQDIEVSVKDNSIILTPVHKKPGNIHELFENWQDDGKRERELDWGKSKGNELQW
ncbi:AbrB/MazE/SpoVT family DNA-binding domain-containing protein [Apilactobacillus ozensis]|uniref:AbrB/MazE/SpoVT family DNA-binding domain-containing protein n=1 Tax=Apilactobacillus ozensis TaxID=866801 RepID=UPI00200B0278|nr:AbrB/MazE/SpoVT family DNA-binding domain-containing protein [Apilactobacillus ozensis]MCK8607225.1 AbrB/MazE/SpoVT family DNA-binding domain-containing protein [Apilactobacillus ozensis]